MADVSKRSAKVNLTGIYGNMAFGPLGMAVMSVNGHPVNPLSDVLMSGQARQTMFQPLKQQGSYEVTYNVTTGELENADTVEAQEAPLATEDVDPLDQYEEDVADFDPIGVGTTSLSREEERRMMYQTMKQPDIASEALQNAQDKRAQLRAQARNQRRETQRAIVESLLAGNPVIIQEPGLRRAEQIQNLREYYIDQFGGLGIRRVNPDDLRNYRRTGVSTATVEEVVEEPVINSAASREVPEGPIPIPENIQSMPAYVRAQDRAERIARRRERQFANLMSFEHRKQPKLEYDKDIRRAERQRLVSQARRAERQAVRAVSVDVSDNVENHNRLLAQVARAEDATKAIGSKNSSVQSQRIQAPQTLTGTLEKIPDEIQREIFSFLQGPVEEVTQYPKPAAGLFHYSDVTYDTLASVSRRAAIAEKQMTMNSSKNVVQAKTNFLKELFKFGNRFIETNNRRRTFDYLVNVYVQSDPLETEQSIFRPFAMVPLMIRDMRGYEETLREAFAAASLNPDIVKPSDKYANLRTALTQWKKEIKKINPRYILEPSKSDYERYAQVYKERSEIASKKYAEHVEKEKKAALAAYEKYKKSGAGQKKTTYSFG